MLESGEAQPPPFDTCQKISEALNLKEDERNVLFTFALSERKDSKFQDFMESTKNKATGLLPHDALPVVKIPIIPWEHIEKYNEIDGPFPPDDPENWVYIPEGGSNMYALRITNDEMATKIQEGDLVVIDPGAKPENGKLVLAKGKRGTFVVRLYKKYHNDVILQPLNTKFPEIVVDRDNHYEIWGIVRKIIIDC